MNNHKGILALALVFVAPDATLGFLIHRQAPAPSSRFDGNNPFRDLDVDIDLAEDCASNFGKYSFEEIKQCRDEIHAHRVQNVALGDSTTPDLIKERFLETELTMQLERLQNDMPESYLFPDEGSFDEGIDTDVGLDGILLDNGLIAMDLPTPRDAASSENRAGTKQVNVWKDLVAAEGVLESIAICGMLGFMMMAPNLN